MLIDSHAHIIDEKYNQTPTELLDEFFTNKDTAIICVGTNKQDSEDIISIVQNYTNAYCAIGIHPHYAPVTTAQDLEFLLRSGKLPSVVAIGEIGLDYFYGKEHSVQQLEIFERQMSIAEQLRLPVIIHSRDATESTLQVLGKYPEVKGVVHCFSGSLETAKQLIKMGYYIGIGGSITFKNSKNLTQIVQTLGINNILLETDCPYLSPEPLRGKINKPINTKIVAQKIANLLNISIEEVINTTYINTKNLFKI